MPQLTTETCAFCLPHVAASAQLSVFKAGTFGLQLVNVLRSFNEVCLMQDLRLHSSSGPATPVEAAATYAPQTAAAAVASPPTAKLLLWQQ